MRKFIILGALAGLMAVPALHASSALAADAAKPRSAELIACSKEADAKGLHGKPRKAFRKACIKKAHGAPA